MQFYTFYKAGVPKASLPQLFRVMRITAFLILVTLLQVSASSYSQQLTMQKSRASLKDIFTQINIQTGYDVVVSSAQLKNTKKVSVSFNKTALQEVLDQVLKNQNLSYTISDKTIVITEKNEEPSFLDKVIARFQRIDIKGMVVDSAGNPIAGATVKVKGFKQSTTTDGAGRFGLANVENNATIVISFLGYKTVELSAIGNFDKIVLAVFSDDLEEVNIVNKGYYQTKKELETGNVSRVTAKDIAEQPVSNPLAALEGRVPGLVISQTTGAPGSAFKVRLRGQNSLRSGNEPLYIVDGVQYPSQVPMPDVSTSPAGGSLNSNLQSGSPLNYLNISDIESIDVLKDADATAIYGSRGASGVILITTKKGQSGTPKVDINFYSGKGRATNFINLLNTQQFIEFRQEQYKNDGISIPNVPTRGAYDLTFWDKNQYTDWQKELLGKTANYNDLQFRLSGGSNNTSYSINSGYHSESTIFAAPGSDQKLSTRFTINNSSSDKKLNMSFTGSFLNDKNNITPVDYSSTAISLAPNAPSLFKNGVLNWEPVTAGTRGSWNNPAALARMTFLGKTNSVIGNANISYEILHNLTIRANVGYNYAKTQETTTTPTTVFDPGLNITTGNANYLNSSNSSWIAEPQIDYSKNLGSLGKFSALFGATFQETSSEFLSSSGTNYTNDIFLVNPKAAGNYTIGDYFSRQYRYNAVFGRLNYNWDDKYLINLTARRDGSSRFGPDNRFANFGAVGLGWIFSKEKLIANNLSWISFGKVRMSYGSTGNDQIPDYLFLDLYANSQESYANLKGLSPQNVYNPYLQWELTKKLEVGLDLSFFNDRINLYTSYFRNVSDNQLLSTPLSLVTGFGSVQTNLPAKVENKGLEFALQTTNVKNNVFSWYSSINLSFARNELLSFSNLASSSYANVFTVGQPINAVKVLKSVGVDPTSGVLEFYNKNGVITKAVNLTAADRTEFVNIAPSFYGGFQNRFKYKSIELSFFFQYAKQRGQGNYAKTSYTYNSNQNVEILSRWKAAGDVSNYSKATQNLASDAANALRLVWGGFTDRSYEDASYLRLKNLSLAYTLPQSTLSQLHVKNLRVYCQGQNLFTITKFTGYDPETQYSFVPPIRVLTVGIQASL